MSKEKLNWYIIDREYVEYLKKCDNRVQNIDYGKSSKPYLGIVLNINNFDYYVPISSAKQKHYTMSENTDFVKITDGRRILSAINLNNMIPILDKDVNLLKYSDISNYYNFENESDKLKYISLLRREMLIINNRKEDIVNRANNLYKTKYEMPKSKMARRCCEFELLEEKCIEYNRVRAMISNVEFINNKESLYYIYDNLNDQDLFEDTVKELDTKENSINIQNMTKDDINNVLSRKIDNELTKNDISTLFEGNEEPK